LVGAGIWSNRRVGNACGSRPQASCLTSGCWWLELRTLAVWMDSQIGGRSCTSAACSPRLGCIVHWVHQEEEECIASSLWRSWRPPRKFPRFEPPRMQAKPFTCERSHTDTLVQPQFPPVLYMNLRLPSTSLSLPRALDSLPTSLVLFPACSLLFHRLFQRLSSAPPVLSRRARVPLARPSAS